jgi:hypothetical protein
MTEKRALPRGFALAAYFMLLAIIIWLAWLTGYSDQQIRDRLTHLEQAAQVEEVEGE